MKKTVVAIAAGLIIAGSGSTQAFAAEYKVQDGDSLWKISNENNVSINQLKQDNNLSSDIIFPNQTLQVNNGKQTSTTSNSEYTVVAGDTLGHIASDKGVTVNQLKSWNKLSSDLIIVGQKLSIGSNAVSSQAPSTTKESNATSNTTEQPKQEAAQTTQKSTSSNESSSSKSASSQGNVSKEVTVTATAYSKEEPGMGHMTASGIDLNDNPRVIAVDPSVIPLGSRVYVEGYGEAIAADTGGAIKGNKIDVHLNSVQECYNWGVKQVKVQILD
ncbi:LysM peptidoglycan-binding and 3D domain-containing protein [Listeria ivanovii]|uniref:LysM peptidoglycan-binding and 3D domain-containing protein n=1 Tax=Listeria ivanovii TaxID=1638 RepID=UPI0005128238|nr:3D domain-containing protein [Listeria ivanovii]AIS63665.1 peptidase M23B [Listeria ivanovii subsp. londoniensis]MBC2255005.1 LysM peptidoglycan-binding domain-containing protein [Listeria ivanovii]MBK1967173.1 LysM peptidoglycan-binding domain-containing protein [Listeria ivanovii subsp. londoniensis]MBK1985110.1 LysM peptidoglycan-binding domain-containing protein [Listeria ivanovii subsp. londoniensis]MBK1996495.1 LysM peptidoglycan-binding domain-containing protein [Listeria ivanovii su